MPPAFRSIDLRRRSVVALPLLLVGCAGAPSEAASPKRRKRKLSTRPPAIVDPIVVDLNRFDPTQPLPGWNGSAPQQGVTGRYPPDRDVLVLGHRRKIWKGRAMVVGGRTVRIHGGAYARGVGARNFLGHASAEGVFVRFRRSPVGGETGDGITLVPDARTQGRSRIVILNCRVENVDGYRSGRHGDCFQVPANYDAPNGYCSSPAEIIIERFTGTTGYQGFFLPNQRFDSSKGYTGGVQQLTAIEVNLRKVRPQTFERAGLAAGRVSLIYMVDMSSDKRGDKPYQKVFRRVYVEPWSGETLDDCLFPNRREGGVSPYTGTKLAPQYARGGRVAVYPPEMMLRGVIHRGAPPRGDYAIRPRRGLIGGKGVPGAGYRSPGYR